MLLGLGAGFGSALDAGVRVLHDSDQEVGEDDRDEEHGEGVHHAHDSGRNRGLEGEESGEGEEEEEGEEGGLGVGMGRG